MPAIKMLWSNAPQILVAYLTKLALCVAMQNALAQMPKSAALVGNHGKICAIHLNHIQIGVLLHLHAAAPKDYVKIKPPIGGFIFGVQ